MSNTYLVRDRRPLFYTDPSTPSASRDSNRWAEPGSYVVVDHPFLEAIIKTQRHKVSKLGEGDLIPDDAIVIRTVDNPYIKAQMRKYDAIIAKRRPDTAVAAAAKVVVQGATEKPSGRTPELVLDKPQKVAAKPEPEPEPETEAEPTEAPQPRLEEIKPTHKGEGGTLSRLKAQRKGK